MTPLNIPRNRATIETELGTEAQCSRCFDFFPADTEFFFASKGKAHSWCKACHVEAPSQVAKSHRRKAQRATGEATA